VFDERISEGFECLSNNISDGIESLMSHQEMAQIPILLYVRTQECSARIQE
jgi:hypothetical protein